MNASKNNCDQILNEILEIKESIRTLESVINNNNEDVIRELIRILKNRLKEKMLEYEACLSKTSMDLKASNILINLDHNQRKIKLKGHIVNLQSEPATGPIKFILMAKQTITYEGSGQEGDPFNDGQAISNTFTFHSEIPAGSAINPGQSFITDELEIPLMYNTETDARYIFRLDIDPNQLLDDLDRTNNVKVMSKFFVAPSIFAQDLPKITEFIKIPS